METSTLAGFGIQISALAEVVWAVVAVLKAVLPGLHPRALALGVGMIVGGLLAYGVLPPTVINTVGAVLLAVLGSNLIHDRIVAAGSSSAGPPAAAGEGK